MRKAITVALATAIAAGGFGFVATSASGSITSASGSVTVPDNRECTKHEYGRVSRGMTMAKVERIIGGKGLENYGGEDFTGYLYGGMTYRKVGAAGCNVAFDHSEHALVVSKDGWFPRS